MYYVKQLLKRIVPDAVILFYHRMLSWAAAVWYRHPSREMMVIGVTGTNGKSTTCHLIGRVLDATGYKVGLATTVEFRIGASQWLNNTKMTMLGRFALQKLLRRMADADVKYAILEVSSQGIAQHRIDNIDFDMAVFTNLTPEHIEAHGGFENYKLEKGKLFASLTTAVNKYAIIEGTEEVVYYGDEFYNRKPSEKVCKTIIVNGNDPYHDYFLSFDALEKYCYGIELNVREECRNVSATQVQLTSTGSDFCVGGMNFEIMLPGMYNVYNTLAAIAVGLTRGMDFSVIAQALSGPIAVPGRFERIDEGQPFEVIVDYAPEVASMTQLYTVIDVIKKGRVIHVLGSCGGGRDKSRRPILGRIAGSHAQIVIVTNEDPYDDDPMTIIQEVAAGAIEVGKKEGETLFTILERKEAISKALALACPGDIVLITGKGAEQAMCVGRGKKIPWDDRRTARQLLQLMRLRNTETQLTQLTWTLPAQG